MPSPPCRKSRWQLVLYPLTCCRFRSMREEEKVPKALHTTLLQELHAKAHFGSRMAVKRRFPFRSVSIIICLGCLLQRYFSKEGRVLYLRDPEGRCRSLFHRSRSPIYCTYTCDRSILVLFFFRCSTYSNLSALWYTQASQTRRIYGGSKAGRWLVLASCALRTSFQLN